MIKQLRFSIAFFFALSLILSSCTSQKDIFYFQDGGAFSGANINYFETTIQPNDILSIEISAAILETALPYNRNVGQSTVNMSNLDAMKLQGYLVNSNGEVTLPVLGKVSAVGKTTTELEDYVNQLLVTGGHLADPVVAVRLLNAKVTVLGEVKQAGTFNFTENNLTVPQALGYAGDLTINGRRDSIMLIREVDGKRLISHVDLRTADWLDNPEYIIKPNDVLVIPPNNAKVKSAGYIGTVATITAITSTLVSIAILIFR